MQLNSKYCFKEPGLSRLSFFISLIIAFSSSFWLWNFVCEFLDPSGANGYFYLKQSESLANGLGFYFKDYSLAFILPTLLTKYLGDSLEAYRISTVAVWFLFSLGVGVLTRNLISKERLYLRNILMVTSVLLVVCTTQLYEITLTFFKNIFSLNLLIWSFVVATTDLKKSKWIGAGALAFLALLSHKSSILIIAIYGLPFLLNKNFKENLKKNMLIVLGAVAFVTTIFLWHFERASAYFLAMLRFFSSPKKWWHWFSTLRWINLEMQITYICLIVAMGLGFWVRKKIPDEKRFYFDGSLIFLFIALHPFQISGPNGPSYRLILFAPALGIPLILAAMAYIPRALLALPLVVAAFVVQPFIHVHPIDNAFTPFDVIKSDVMRITEFVTPEDHLTSHHGLEFFVDYVTGIRSRSFLSDHPEKKDFRIAYIAKSWIRKPEIQEGIRKLGILEIGSEYLLLKESDWQELKIRFKIPKHWKNPEEHRPNFISE